MATLSMARGLPFIPAARMGAIALLAVVAACTAVPKTEDGSVAPRPPEIVQKVCAQDHPAEIAACTQLPLRERPSKIAYQKCLEFNRIEPKRCMELRLAFETDLRTYLNASLFAPTQRSGGTEAPISPEISPGKLQALHHTAEELYDATSKDAQTFGAALLIPELRRRVEDVFHQRLSDVSLRNLAAKARAESLYWYEYMQGIEKKQAQSN